MERTADEHRRFVNWFAGKMLQALERNAHKPHWLTMTAKELAAKHREEQWELVAAVALQADPQAIIMEAVDVALCAAFEADHARARMERE